jgi:bacillithiol system protein YtxJ
MAWLPLTSSEDWQALLLASFQAPVLVFKHSPRCGTSAFIRERLSNALSLKDLAFHEVDVIRERTLSRNIAESVSVLHESPQVLLLKNGECVWAEDHMAISFEEILKEYDRLTLHEYAPPRYPADL